jgi:hypothetical protein
MKNKQIINYSEDQILSAIEGMQAFYELGSKIDERKELEWIVTPIESGVIINARFLTGVKLAKNECDPQIQRDNEYFSDLIHTLAFNSDYMSYLAEHINDTLQEVDAIDFKED